MYQMVNPAISPLKNLLRGNQRQHRTMPSIQQRIGEHTCCAGVLVEYAVFQGVVGFYIVCIFDIFELS